MRAEGIGNAATLSGVGSLDRYHFHVVKTTNMPPGNTFVRGEGPFDILSVTVAAIALTTARHWLIFLDGLTKAFTAYNRPAAFFLTSTDVTGFMLGAVAPGLPRTGVHVLISMLALVGLIQGKSMWRHPSARGCLIAGAVL